MNSYGELGLGNNTQYNSPKKINSLIGKNITSMSLGFSHTCAYNSFSVYCFGINEYIKK
jgi:hypothetical protein